MVLGGLGGVEIVSEVEKGSEVDGSRGAEDVGGVMSGVGSLDGVDDAVQRSRERY